MLQAVQKIVLNGCSAQVTIPRRMLFAQSLRPGDFVELTLQDDGTFSIRPWRRQEDATRRSPGIVDERPAPLPR